MLGEVRPILPPQNMQLIFRAQNLFLGGEASRHGVGLQPRYRSATSGDTTMEQVKLLLDLPFDVLAMLAAGYLSYRLAYIGRDVHHSPIDVTFISLIFAALTKLYAILIAQALDAAERPLQAELNFLIAAVIAIASAAVWRRWGQRWTFDALRASKISDHDGQPDVWHSMLARQLKGPTRLVVCLKNGTDLMCEQLARFNEAPMGPCLFGSDGSIAMYVTDVRKAGAEEWEEVAPYDPDFAIWGYEMSFIPASEIARIDVSRPA